jgi:uncharacterized protein YacL
MNSALILTRILFMVLSILFMTLYSISAESKILTGVGLGILLVAVLIGFDVVFKRFNLRTFNIAVIGLFAGYLMGEALLLPVSAVLDIIKDSLSLSSHALQGLKISLLLFGMYLGTLIALRSADQLAVSIPFFRFSPLAEKKKDLLIDFSALTDPRIIDLASSGIADDHLVLPRFMVKELHVQAESQEELQRMKARKALEIIKKLEQIPQLNLRYTDTNLLDIKDSWGKLTRLANLLNANILTADITRLQTNTVDGTRVINIHALSNALKPLTQAGEKIRIRIQRYGKEPRQGVGYLDDGTMVVVNGGGEYIGESIDATVLSVKHTTAGRMIFCNAQEMFSASGAYDFGE